MVQLQIRRLLQIQRIVSQGIFVLQRALICTCIHIQKHFWICVASKEKEQQQIYTHMYILGVFALGGGFHTIHAMVNKVLTSYGCPGKVHPEII